VHRDQGYRRWGLALGAAVEAVGARSQAAVATAAETSFAQEVVAPGGLVSGLIQPTRVASAKLVALEETAQWCGRDRLPLASVKGKTHM
jgi:hypothetical protein